MPFWNARDFARDEHREVRVVEDDPLRPERLPERVAVVEPHVDLDVLLPREPHPERIEDLGERPVMHRLAVDENPVEIEDDRFGPGERKVFHCRGIIISHAAGGLVGVPPIPRAFPVKVW